MRVLFLLCTLLMFTSCYDPVENSSAKEEVETYSVTLFADEHGITVPTGQISLPLDSTLVVKATANENYLFHKWVQVGIDSIPLSDSGSAVIRLKESESGTIALKALFVPKVCTVVVKNSDSAYSLTPKDTLLISYGEKLSVSTKAKEGYTFHKWQFSDINALSTTSLVDEALVVTVLGNGSITPLFFAENSETLMCTVMVKASDSAHTLTPQDRLVVPYGEKISISTKARVGYAFDRWQLSDMNTLLLSSLVEESVVVTVLGSATICPLFRALHHEVTIDSAENGTINNVGTFTLSEHDSLEIIATPNEHYRFIQWKQVGETTVPIDDITSPTTYIRGVVGTGAIEAVFERRQVEAMYSSSFLATSRTSTLLIDLFDEEGRSLRIQEGDILEMRVQNIMTTFVPREVTVSTMEGTAGGVATVEELLAFMQNCLRDSVNGPGIKGAAVTMGLDGNLNLAVGGETLTSVYVTNKTRPISAVYVQNLFNWSGNITGIVNFLSGTFLRPAGEDDVIRKLYTKEGRPLGLEAGDEIILVGIFDGEKLPNGATNFVLGDDWGEQRLLSELIAHIQSRLDQAMGRYFEVFVNSEDNNFPKGAIVIKPSETNLLTFSGISVTANNSNNNPTSPVAFNKNMIFTYRYEDDL